MAQLIRLAEHPLGRRRKAQPIHLTRSELQQLLSLYSRKVAADEWRDYAIDCRPDGAVFSVYRHSHDRPAFTISKRAGRFTVHQGSMKLSDAASLSDALAVFRRQLALVKR